MKGDYQYNVLALGEVFLDNNKQLLEKVSQMIIQEISKNDELVDEHVINKNNLPTSLLKVFDKGVTHLKEIKIFYIGDGLRQYLTSIEIF